MSSIYQSYEIVNFLINLLSVTSIYLRFPVVINQQLTTINQISLTCWSGWCGLVVFEISLRLLVIWIIWIFYRRFLLRQPLRFLFLFFRIGTAAATRRRTARRWWGRRTRRGRWRRGTRRFSFIVDLFVFSTPSVLVWRSRSLSSNFSIKFVLVGLINESERKTQPGLGGGRVEALQ